MDGNAQRDRERQISAVEALEQLFVAVKRGEIAIVDFYVNKSINDPLRMNIEMKTVRASPDALPAAENAPYGL
jgi:hypothetical protein